MNIDHGDVVVMNTSFTKEIGYRMWCNIEFYATDKVKFETGVV